LAVWNSERVLSNCDAATRYSAFRAEETSSRFDEAVYRFYFSLVQHYPDTEMIAEEELDSSPWACGLDVADDHVIMALLPDRYAEAFPSILELAEAHGLVCFDPQNVKVHLPTRLREGRKSSEALQVSSYRTGRH